MILDSLGNEKYLKCSVEQVLRLTIKSTALVLVEQMLSYVMRAYRARARDAREISKHLDSIKGCRVTYDRCFYNVLRQNSY